MSAKDSKRTAQPLPVEVVPRPRPPAHLFYPRSSFFYAMSNCEAAFELSQASGEEPPTPFSDRGTEVHGVISERIDRATADQGLLEEADYLESVYLKTFGPWLQGDRWTTVREVRIWMRLGLRPVYSGQPDLYNVNEAESLALLSDWKTGWHPLDEYVATNCQIRSYVPLVDEALKHRLDAIVAGIHKPGTNSPPAVFTREAINDARAWSIEVATKAVEKGPKKPNRGAWCKYCSGKVLCPLWRDEVTTLSTFADTIVADIPDSQLRALAPRLELAGVVVDRLLKRLESRVRDRPEFFRDWRFEPGDHRRKIDDTFSAYNVLVNEKKLMSPGEFLLASRLVVTDIERTIKKNKNLSLKDTKKLMGEVLDGIMEVHRNKDSLVYDPK